MLIGAELGSEIGRMIARLLLWAELFGRIGSYGWGCLKDKDVVCRNMAPLSREVATDAQCVFLNICEISYFHGSEMAVSASKMGYVDEVSNGLGLYPLVVAVNPGVGFFFQNAFGDLPELRGSLRFVKFGGRH